MLTPIIDEYRICYSYGMGSEIGYSETKVDRMMLLMFLLVAPKVATFVTDEL